MQGLGKYREAPPAVLLLGPSASPVTHRFAPGVEHSEEVRLVALLREGWDKAPSFVAVVDVVVDSGRVTAVVPLLQGVVLSPDAVGVGVLSGCGRIEGQDENRRSIEKTAASSVWCFGRGAARLIVIVGDTQHREKHETGTQATKQG